MKKLLLLLPLLVMACDSSSNKSSTQAKRLEPVKLELASPDQAVKTWWKVRDGFELVDSQACKARMEAYRESEPNKAAQKMTTGLAQQQPGAEMPGVCELESYAREIVEVKVESETRAVVLAKIKPTTQIPAGVTPDAEDMKRRGEGTLYKYLLEKVGSDWKIAQVYSHSQFDKDPWSAEFKEAKPYVHSLVYGEQ